MNKLSELHRNHLHFHACWLLNNVVDYRAFDMRSFTCGGDDESDDPEKICKTSACSLGYAVFWTPYKLPRWDGGIDWYNFSIELFGIYEGDHVEVWDWLFSHRWHYADNTAKGAAQRILYYLEYGVPDEYDVGLMMHGEMTLCYADMKT